MPVPAQAVPDEPHPDVPASKQAATLDEPNPDVPEHNLVVVLPSPMSALNPVAPVELLLTRTVPALLQS